MKTLGVCAINILNNKYTMAYAFRTHYQSLVFCVVYYRSWFVRLSFVFSFPLSFTASDFLFDIFIFLLSTYYIST